MGNHFSLVLQLHHGFITYDYLWNYMTSFYELIKLPLRVDESMQMLLKGQFSSEALQYYLRKDLKRYLPKNENCH